MKIYYTPYSIKMKMCTQRFYYSSKFSKFIQGTWSAHFFVKHIQTEKISSWNGPTVHVAALWASVSLLEEKSKICQKLNELLSWNGLTVHVCCFMLARASTKTFVSRIRIRWPSPKNSGKKSSLTKKFVSRVTR